MRPVTLARIGLLGAVVLAASWLAALPATVSGLEEETFRIFNDLPDWLEYPGWPIMQLGSIIAVPIVVVACVAIFRDWKVPAMVAGAGVGAWLIAKVIKEIVGRGRPEAFFSDINLRPAWEGLGFVSGHAGVGFAIALVLSVSLPKAWRWWIWSIAVLAGLLRMYTAAHLPLDVIGGWGLGMITASIALLVGRRSKVVV